MVPASNILTHEGEYLLSCDVVSNLETKDKETYEMVEYYQNPVKLWLRLVPQNNTFGACTDCYNHIIQ